MTTPPRHFHPWIGPSFGDGPLGEKRLLVVGDSHYSDVPADDHADLTKLLLKDIRNGTRTFPFFTKISGLLGERTLTRAAVWDAIAFYNFIPEMAGSTHDTRPSSAMWQAAGQPFEHVLATVKPARVLVAARSVWDALSAKLMTGWTSAPISIGEPEAFFDWRGPDSTSVRATWINHPSSRGFSPARWVERVETLLR